MGAGAVVTSTSKFFRFDFSMPTSDATMDLRVVSSSSVGSAEAAMLKKTSTVNVVAVVGYGDGAVGTWVGDD